MLILLEILDECRGGEYKFEDFKGFQDAALYFRLLLHTRVVFCFLKVGYLVFAA